MLARSEICRPRKHSRGCSKRPWGSADSTSEVRWGSYGRRLPRRIERWRDRDRNAPDSRGSSSSARRGIWRRSNRMRSGVARCLSKEMILGPRAPPCNKLGLRAGGYILDPVLSVQQTKRSSATPGEQRRQSRPKPRHIDWRGVRAWLQTGLWDSQGGRSRTHN